MRNYRQYAMILALALGVGMIGLSAAQTAKQSAHHGINSKNPMVGMIFCNKMQTGELCPTGTFYTLKVPAAAKAKWAATIESYDDAIEAANRRLLSESKPLLDAAQYSQMQRFLSPGLNPLMNDLLTREGRMPGVPAKH